MPSKESGNEEQSETQSDANTEANVTRIPELDDPITEQEVRQAIRNLKHGKASGLDKTVENFLNILKIL